MPRGGSPKRHAQAVFSIALAQDQLEPWLDSLGQLSRLSQDPLVRAVMDNPKLSFQDKVGLLPDRVAGLSPLAMNLLALLITRGRLRLAPQIYQEYQKLLNAHRGIATAEVVTAIPLEEAEKEAIARRLEAISGCKITLTTRVDPTILGGLVAYIGDTLLDGSLRSKLKALRKGLVTSGR